MYLLSNMYVWYILIKEEKNWTELLFKINEIWHQELTYIKVVFIVHFMASLIDWLNGSFTPYRVFCWDLQIVTNG